MMNENIKVKVADLITDGHLFIGDGYRAKNSELAAEGLPFARVSNISDGFHFDGADCFPAENIAKVGNKVSQPSDVVFTSKGTVGRFAFVRENTPQFVYSPQLCFWRSLNAKVIYPDYLFYWMSSVEFYHQFKSVAGQTDMAEYVSLTDQRRMSITLPPLAEQRAIASVLGSLDEQIELLRRQNATLERIAQTLFRAWFVEFEPVRAKAAGVSPVGLDAATASLFPDGFENEGPNAGLPKGWTYENLTAFATIKGGKQLDSSKIAQQDLFPVFGGNGIMGYTEEPNAEPFVINVGRVGAYCGNFFWTDQKSWINNNASAITPNDVSNFPFLFLSLRSMDIEKIKKGAAQPFVSNSDIAAETFAAPPSELRAIFNKIAYSFFKQIGNNLRQARTLAGIRDQLLPRLIAGDLRVPASLMRDETS